MQTPDVGSNYHASSSFATLVTNMDIVATYWFQEVFHQCLQLLINEKGSCWSRYL